MYINSPDAYACLAANASTECKFEPPNDDIWRPGIRQINSSGEEYLTGGSSIGCETNDGSNSASWVDATVSSEHSTCGHDGGRGGPDGDWDLQSFATRFGKSFEEYNKTKDPVMSETQWNYAKKCATKMPRPVPSKTQEREYDDANTINPDPFHLYGAGTTKKHDKRTTFSEAAYLKNVIFKGIRQRAHHLIKRVNEMYKMVTDTSKPFTIDYFTKNEMAPARKSITMPPGYMVAEWPAETANRRTRRVVCYLNKILTKTGYMNGATFSDLSRLITYLDMSIYDLCFACNQCKGVLSEDEQDNSWGAWASSKWTGDKVHDPYCCYRGQDGEYYEKALADINMSIKGLDLEYVEYWIFGLYNQINKSVWWDQVNTSLDN